MKKHQPSPDCLHCEVRFKSVFCDLNKDVLTQLNLNKGCTFFKKGQLIFSEGSFPHGLYCINAGKIKIVHLGEMGKEQILRFAKGGDIIGYNSLLSGETYSCSAIAMEDSSVCFISRAFFLNMLANNMKLTMKMMTLLSNELKIAAQKLTSMAQKPVRERVAEAILFIKEIYGYEIDNATIDLSLSREDIANIVGTSRETATRLLSEFKDDGIIEINGKKIKITNRQKLVKTANLYD